MSCKHEQIHADVKMVHLCNISRWQAEIRISCTQCGEAFRFLGLPPGLDLNGAAVSLDGTEARLAMLPVSQSAAPLDGPTGFTVRGKQGDAVH